MAKACEVLAERWTPLLVRELLSGSHRFNDLQRGVPLMSRSLLAKRLRELEDAGIVERRVARGDRRGHEYHLTPAGEELRPIIEGLGAWGQRWLVSDVREGDLDASLLMWDIRRNVHLDAVPDRRTVIRIDFPDVSGAEGRWWLIVDEGEADLCMTNPGFEVDLAVAVPLRGLTRYWLGRATWRELVAEGMRLEGPRWLQRALPRWLGRSGFAKVPHAAGRRQPPTDRQPGTG
ncbi:MAG: winged helix-turn-helix transcriptional regulator [Myxococcota bacterium]